MAPCVNKECRSISPNVNSDSGVGNDGGSSHSVGRTTLREVSFRKDRGYSIMIPVKVNNSDNLAVVDTAAQVTVLSKDFAVGLGISLTGADKVLLKGAAKEGSMVASIVKGIKLAIGKSVFQWDVYVAPITDDIILGLDFLVANECVVDLKSSAVIIEGEVIPAVICRHGGEEFSVCRVTLSQRVVVPPQSCAQGMVSIDGVCSTGYVISPFLIKTDLACPSVVVTGKGRVPMTFVNLGSNFITLKPGKLVGSAMELGDVLLPDISCNRSSDQDSGSPSLMLTSNTGNGDRVASPGSSTSLMVSSCAGDVDHLASPRDSDTTILEESLVSEATVKCITAGQDVTEVESHMIVPEHLKSLLERSSPNLDNEQIRELASLMKDYSDVFSEHDLDLGCFTGVTHKIDTKDAQPVKHRLRRVPLGFENEEEKHLKKMLEAQVIRPSNSEWAAAPVLVRKKDGGVRWCIDYRNLNSLTVKDTYPLPLIEECLDTLGGNLFYSSCDMTSSYWQIPLEPSDSHKTAFVTKYGLFEHCRMPFGLCNAPATFMRAMNFVLRGLTWSVVLAFLDDVLILGKSSQEHFDNVRLVLDRFREHRIKLKPSKCVFFQTELKFLGKLVSREGVRIDPEKVEKVVNWPQPKCTKDVESFLGLVNYHREHVRQFAEIASPLYSLTGPKIKFVWEQQHTEAFGKLKEVLVSAPVLGYPRNEGAYILDCDASGTAIGAELLQLQDGAYRVISYGSYALTPAQRKYCTTRKELLAIIRFTRQYRHYLLGRKFLVRTDHSSLAWLMRFRYIEGQLARWLEEISQYDMEIVHRKGKLHQNADSLSRIPDELEFCDCYRAGIDIEQLPCGGCSYCTRAHNQWSRFEEHVDYVVPLAVRSITQGSPVQEDSSEDEGEEPDGSGTDWFTSYSLQELHGHQEEDADLQPLLSWLGSAEEPATDVLQLQSPATKHLWLCRSQLSLEHGVLYYKWEDVTPRRCFVVPRSLRDEVLRQCHDVRLAGHLGQTKTIEIAKKSFFWYNMSTDCKNYVASCAACSVHKKPRVWPRAGLRKYHAGAPMERIHIDILGPFTASAAGNVYILMIVDQFSKWFECYALPNQTAETIVEKVVNEFIARFGCPLYIHSDQGKNVDGKLVRAICDLLEITKTRTTPYRPAANGQVERYNRLLLQMVRCCVKGATRDWDKYLPQLAAAVRSMPNRSTGYTANLMMLGREVLSPRDLTFRLFDQAVDYDPPAYVRELLDILRAVHQKAREHLKVAQARQKKTYDLKLFDRCYEVGDLVYKLESAKRPGQSKKLSRVWSGPYLVVKVFSPVLYTIKAKRKEWVCHHDRLKPCQDRFIPLWLRRMRHELLELDTTIAYDEEEDDEDFLEDVFRDLFREQDEEQLDVSFSSADIIMSTPTPLQDADAVTPEVVVETSQPHGSSPTGTSQKSPVKTRVGRKIVPPPHLQDYL